MIWLDLDNTPHLPLLQGRTRALTGGRLRVLDMFRRHAQTEDLPRLSHIEHQSVGVRVGRSKIHKLMNLAHGGSRCAWQ